MVGCHTSYIIPMSYSYWCFPPQPNNPHCLVIQPLSLKRCPRYSRLNDISLVYSSSITKATEVFTLVTSILYYFHSLFNDYTRPYIFIKSRSSWLDNFKNVCCFYFSDAKIVISNDSRKRVRIFFISPKLFEKKISVISNWVSLFLL